MPLDPKFKLKGSVFKKSWCGTFESTSFGKKEGRKQRFFDGTETCHWKDQGKEGGGEGESAFDLNAQARDSLKGS